MICNLQLQDVHNGTDYSKKTRVQVNVNRLYSPATLCTQSKMKVTSIWVTLYMCKVQKNTVKLAVVTVKCLILFSNVLKNWWNFNNVSGGKWKHNLVISMHALDSILLTFSYRNIYHETINLWVIVQVEDVVITKH